MQAASCDRLPAVIIMVVVTHAYGPQRLATVEPRSVRVASATLSLQKVAADGSGAGEEHRSFIVLRSSSQPTEGGERLAVFLRAGLAGAATRQ